MLSFSLSTLCMKTQLGPISSLACIRGTYSRTSVAEWKISTMDNRTMPGSPIIKNAPLGLTLEIPSLYQYTTSRYDVPSGWDIPESKSNVWQHFLALRKEWSCRKEGGSTPYWPECAARDNKTVNTSSRHKDQGKSYRLQKGKDRLSGQQLFFALRREGK